MTDLVEIKQQTYAQLHALAAGADPDSAYHADAEWRASHPFNEQVGLAAIGESWAALRRALPDMERRDSIFVAGQDRSAAATGDRVLVASMGCYQGTFEADLVGIPATKGVVHLRSCEVHEVRDGRIAQSTLLFDFLDLMRQAGIWPVAPSLGAEGLWPGPATCDGLKLETAETARGAEALERVLAMHAALLSFDGKTLESMPHEPYWTDNFLWYGPAGIGATRGLRGFRAHHQIPFLIGFPDRRAGGHYVRFGDGDYVVTGGWPSVVATHRGEWLGLPPTGRHIEMRVMDFYRFDGDRIAENWVPIDVLHMLLQMGFDVFARLEHLRGAPRLDLPG